MYTMFRTFGIPTYFVSNSMITCGHSVGLQYTMANLTIQLEMKIVIILLELYVI